MDYRRLKAARENAAGGFRCAARGLQRSRPCHGGSGEALGWTSKLTARQLGARLRFAAGLCFAGDLVLGSAV